MLAVRPVKRAEKGTTSVVVAVDPLHVPDMANPSDLSPAPARSPPPTLPSSPPSAGRAATLDTLLLYAKQRHKLGRSALSSITVLPTDALTKAVRKEPLRGRL